MFGRKEKKENEQLRQRISELEKILDSIGGGDITRMQDVRAGLQQDIDSAKADLSSAQGELNKTATDLQHVHSELIQTRDGIKLQSFGLFDFANPAEDAVRLSTQLEQVRSQIKEQVRNKNAVSATSNFTFNNSTAKGRSFVNKMCKVALRSYNAEVENAISRMKAGNLEAAAKRLEKAREQVERMGDMISLRVMPSYHQLRLQELELAAIHLEAKKAAKEAEREERARLREEKKAQDEMAAERKHLDKEKSHYQNVIQKLRDQGRLDELSELEERLALIQHSIEDVDYRAANIRAGYVYVISNVGSFGERMVKIGMTRRLDPMDRVRELGDASVPFNFDVHTLHFSQDAVSVESELHRRFEMQKVNRVNTRREFFYVTPAEVKEALAGIDGSVLEFKDEPEADQFHQSIAMREALIDTHQ